MGYDEVRDNIADLEQQLEEYLDQQRKRFGVSMHYTTSEKKEYLIEVPVGEAEGVRRHIHNCWLLLLHLRSVITELMGGGS